MSSAAWVALAIGIASVIVMPAIKVLYRIDRRVHSLWTNHIPHVYTELQRITGNQPPKLED